MNKLKKLLLNWEDTPKKNKKIHFFFKKECLKIKIKIMLQKIQNMFIKHKSNVISVIIFTTLFLILIRSIQISNESLVKAKEELGVYKKSSLIEYRQQYNTIIEEKNKLVELQEQLKKQEEFKKWQSECIMNGINEFVKNGEEIKCDKVGK